MSTSVMNTASAKATVKPQSWVVTGKMAAHLKQFGVPPVEASVTVIATLDAWDSIGCLNANGSVAYATVWLCSAPINMVVHAVTEHLRELFLTTGSLPESLDITSIIENVQAETAKKEAQYKADRIAREEKSAKEAEASKAARAAFCAERDAWVAAHGSARLQRSIAEGIECDSVYRDERLAVDRPGWRWYDTPRNVPESAFKVLDAARNFDVSATLFFHTVDDKPEFDDDGYETGETIEGWKGYTAEADFLGKTIVFGLPAEFH